MVAETHKPLMIMLYNEAYDQLISTKFTTTATEYCTDFQRNLQNFSDAAVNLASVVFTCQNYNVTDGMACLIFFKGTTHVEWLQAWIEIGTVGQDSLGFVPLEKMIAALRSVSGSRGIAALQHSHAISNSIAAAAQTTTGSSQCALDLNTLCSRCRHRHTNAESYRLHPELAVGAKSQGFKDNKKTGRPIRK